jgi:hypothetical protein
MAKYGILKQRARDPAKDGKCLAVSTTMPWKLYGK